MRAVQARGRPPAGSRKARRVRAFSAAIGIALALQAAPGWSRRAAAIDASGLQVLHPDFHSRLGARILASVTTPGATRLRVVLTGPHGYRRVLADVPVPRTEDAHVATLDLRRLRAGRYTLTSEAFDRFGIPLARRTETFTRAIDGAPKVGFDEHNALRVDGEVVFPVTTWMADPARGPWAPGPGRVIRESHLQREDGVYDARTFASFVDESAQHGAWVIGPARGDPAAADIEGVVRAAKSKGALLAWMWVDEPEYAGLSPAQVRRWTERTHALDPERPVAMNLAGSVFLGQGGDRATARAFTADLVQAGRPAPADWISTDYYPVAFSPAFGMETQEAFDNYAAHLRTVRAWTKDLYPIKTFVEVASQPGMSSERVPTPEQVWAETWIAVANGAKGISWFPYDGARDPRTEQVQSRAAAYLTHFAGRLAGADSRRVTRRHLDGDRVDFVAKEDGHTLYVFAVNRDVDDPATVRFELSGRVPVSVRVYGEDRVLRPSAGGFSDEFEPYGVHIYEVRTQTSPRRPHPRRHLPPDPRWWMPTTWTWLLAGAATSSRAAVRTPPAPATGGDGVLGWRASR